MIFKLNQNEVFMKSILKNKICALVAIFLGLGSASAFANAESVGKKVDDAAKKAKETAINAYEKAAEEVAEAEETLKEKIAEKAQEVKDKAEESNKN